MFRSQNNFFLFQVLFVAFSLAREFDNRITGTPIVECERDFIRVTVPTLKPFKGKVFVKGEYTNKDCVKYYGNLQQNRAGFSQTQGFKNSNLGNNGRSDLTGGRRGTNNYGTESGGHGTNNYGTENDRGINNLGQQNFGTNKASAGTFEPKFPKTMMNHGEEGFLSSRPRHRPDAPFVIPKTSKPSTFPGLSPSGSSNRNERPLSCPPCDKCPSANRKTTVLLDDEYSFERDGLHIITPRKRRSSDSEAALEVKLGTCNARRDRTINPPGIHVSFTIVVNFHENFITKVDKAYHIACSYEEADRSVATQIDVSPPPETNLQGTIDPPKCQYSIQSSHGKSISHVLVGETVEHLWKCHSANGYSDVHKVFGLLVHNCFIEDGQGKREKIIDEQGCSMDPLVIGTPEYSKTSLSASIKALVVKFPDRDFVDFQCAIHMCVKDEGNCNGITPPNCSQSSRSRRHTTDSSNITLTSLDDWKLHAQRLTVMDIDSKVTDLDLQKLSNIDFDFPQPSSLQDPINPKELCVSVLHFGLLIAATTFLFTVSLTVFLGIMFFRNSKVVNY